MKFTLSFLILCAALSGCSDVPPQERVAGHTVVTIDGCEYIFLRNGNPSMSSYAMTLTHKGNCRNPIHKHNQ